ncbi:hypothetical protein ACFQ60_03085 [Streptomyces zhihengii]
MLLASYPYGTVLPIGKELAQQLGARPEHVRAAMADLEMGGEVAYRGGAVTG